MAHARSCLCCHGRRAMIGGAIATAMVGRAVRAQTTLAPDDSVATLMAGNARFVAGQLHSFGEDVRALQRNTVAKQEPFAAVLSCADSRVPVELIFDQSLGRIFANRLAGNVATPEIIASLEYGAAVLGTTAILVLGHSNCGAVAAAMAGKPVPGQISTLYRPIRPAIDRAHGDLEAAIRANAMIQAGLLRDASPVLSDLVKQGKLKIAAGYYDLATGKVSLLG